MIFLIDAEIFFDKIQHPCMKKKKKQTSPGHGNGGNIDAQW